LLLVKNMNKSLIETIGEPKKTTIYYTKIKEIGDTAIYAVALFDSVVYIKVRLKEKMTGNIFEWLLEPHVEKVGLSLDEVLEND